MSIPRGGILFLRHHHLLLRAGGQPRHHGCVDRRERRALRERADAVAAWSRRAREAWAWRSATEKSARSRWDAVNERAVAIRRGDSVLWSLIPLTRDDLGLVHVCAARANLPEVSDAEFGHWRRLAGPAAEALGEVQWLTTWRRFFAGAERRRLASEAAALLDELHAWGTEHDAAGMVERWATPVPRVVADDLTLDDLTEERLALRLDDGVSLGMLRPASFGELPRALADLAAAVASEAPYIAEVRRSAEALRAPLVAEKLATMPVTELTRVTTDRLRPDLLLDSGHSTVAAVRALNLNQLTEIHGIGPTTARATRRAAEAMVELTAAETAVRIDPEHRTLEAEEVLAALAAWDAVRRTRGAADDLRTAELLSPLGPALTDEVTRALVVTGTERVSALADAIDAVLRRADLVAAATPGQPPTEVWSDFLARPAEYHALLAELGYLSRDEERVYGELPTDLVDEVRAQPLRTDHLKVTLRGYQAFAARFALSQRRVVIGDEMGLGKTVEALAVLAHLWATGAQHFLVVCPAGLVTNWVREIQRHTDLPVHRLHGEGFRTPAAWESRATAWRTGGGIAVTSYSTLDHLIPRDVQLAGLVVDEAHYVKNPKTYRAREVRRRIDVADRVLLMSGTPMENHVGDFTTLLGYIRPELVAGEELPPRLFRRQVAPAYLRRNIEDVLDELPDLVEITEWVDMSEADREAYRTAVEAGNFAAMRRAAMLSGKASAKVERLLELVVEAEETGRRMVVFSYFRDVVASLAEVLPGEVFGPLTGDVPPDRRQRIIDEFSEADHGAVLLSQITTGGVGLNIQAASVVVICEPQLKPTTEAQAIGRAHRMGQLRSVQVHRLLSEGAVDERIAEALADKRAQFDAFARESAMADASPEAVAWADAEIDDTAALVAAEQERLLYSPPEVVAPED